MQLAPIAWAHVKHEMLGVPAVEFAHPEDVDEQLFDAADNPEFGTRSQPAVCDAHDDHVGDCHHDCRRHDLDDVALAQSARGVHQEPLFNLSVKAIPRRNLHSVLLQLVPVDETGARGQDQLDCVLLD